MNNNKCIILVSNRLPIAIKKVGKQRTITPSSGGLATGLSSLKDTHEIKWIGYPGITSDDTNSENMKQSKSYFDKSKYLYPIYLTSQEIKMYYNGYSNNTLWPLFHYFPMNTRFKNEYWEYYVNVNKKFADKVLSVVKSGDIIWVHDYQLMLLPQLIKKEKPDVKVGFFLHIPFPSFEVFRLLPDRKALLQGVLAADLIGFHTYSYYRHFLSSVLRICGYENQFGKFNIDNKITKVDVYPMGIDYKKYSDINDTKILYERETILKSFADKKILLSIDRMDYTKGLLTRLKGFKTFLQEHPEFIGKIVFVMVCVPSRTTIKLYNDLRIKTETLVSEINGLFSNLTWTPIVYMYQSVPFEKLMALYCASDVALLTPLRDGMNLVAKEFVASKQDSTGVLIISEMAGVAEEFPEAIVVNPNNIKQIADSIYEALTMEEDEKKRRLDAMQRRLLKYDIVKWGDNFIKDLIGIEHSDEKLSSIRVTDKVSDAIVKRFNEVDRKLVALDYDGTLVGFDKNPSKARPSATLKDILKKLSLNCDLVIISGRDRYFMESIFDGLNISLVAEHGAWYKVKGDADWTQPFEISNEWKTQVRPLFDVFSDRSPGTFFEEKEHSFVWHYRMADPEFAKQRLYELKEHLYKIIANLNLCLMDGNKALEIKSIDINKGKALSYFMSKEKYEFVMAIGDDVTDEDMFKVLGFDDFSIKVGSSKTNASYYLRDCNEVIKIIDRLVL